MIHNSRWRIGFIVSTLFLLWTIVFAFVLSYMLPMGPGLGLFIITIGVFILMALAMLLLAFFGQTRPISFGLAIPLLFVQIGLLILTFNAWDLLTRLLVNLPGFLTLLIVGIIYLTRGRDSVKQLNRLE